MHQSVQDAFIPFNEPLEARLPFMYLDSLSLVTTGIGNLIDADDPKHFGSNAHLTPDAFNLGWAPRNGGPPSTNAEIEAEYQTVKISGTANQSIAARKQITSLEITDQAIDQFVLTKLAAFETTLKQNASYTNLDAWPADAQLGILSMAWAMGPKFSFPNFAAAALAQDWVTAATESHMNDAGNPGLRPRNVRNQLLFTISSWVAAPPPGDFTLLGFDASDTLEGNMRSGRFPTPLNSEIGVQTALEALATSLSNPAYDPKGLDGIFVGSVSPSNTQKALSQFQTDQGLPATPNAATIADVDGATIAALATALDTQGLSHWLP